MISDEAFQKLNSTLWRIENLYKIINKQGHLINLKLNPFQKEYLLKRNGHKRNIILKPRQKGFTTYSSIELLDYTIWNPNTTTAIIAHEREAVTKIFEIVKRAFNNIPEDLRPSTKYDNKNEIQFLEGFDGTPLNSKIYVSLKLRSGTTQRLHISEAAFIEGTKRQELNAGSKQTVPMNGWITEETTGNGFNEFFDEVMESKTSWRIKDGIPQHLKKKVYFFSWLDDNEYTIGVVPEDLQPLDKEEQRLVALGATYPHLAWRRWKLKDFSKSTKPTTLQPKQLFKQEYPATLEEAFQSSGSTYFDYEIIEKITPKEYEASKKIEGLNVWYIPQNGKRYCIGVDPSNGKNIDFAAISVWSEDYKQVAQWYGYRDPDEVADLTAAIARLYNGARVIPENNLVTTVLRLRKIYTSAAIYRYTREDKITKKKSLEYGFNTNSKTRRELTDGFRSLLREGELEINSAITKSEMLTFLVNENGKPEHAPGKHDDALFADMLAIHYLQKPDWMGLYK